MNEVEYKTDEENFQEALIDVRRMATREINEELRLRGAYHGWYVRALDQVLTERVAQTLSEVILK